MLLGVVGSREYRNLHEVDEWLGHFLLDAEEQLTGLVSGGARGVDQAAEKWAGEHNLPVFSFRPVNIHDANNPWAIDRREYRESGVMTSTILPGRYRSFAAAAFVRNGYIVEFADGVVAFHDGSSRGTKDSIEKARALGKLLAVAR